MTITPIENVNEVNKIIRNELIKQSGLKGQFVRNITSTYGQDLDMLLSHSNYSSLERDNVCILFEIEEDDIDQISEEESTNHSSIYCYNVVKLVIYGNSSDYVAKQLKARFETDKVRDDLINQGVYLSNISNIRSINEFKNNVMWLRTDLDLHIAFKLDIKQVDDYEPFYEGHLEDIIKLD